MLRTLDQARGRSSAEQLCGACGFCCNGVLFADVQLQPGDDLARLKALGFEIAGPALRGDRAGAGGAKATTQRARSQHFRHPCSAFVNGRCAVYEERPRYCQDFECLLLRNALAGRVSTQQALGTIQKTASVADTVRGHLSALGDADELLPLAARFRRTTARMEQIGLDEELGDVYGQLTLAMHDLNLLLSENFYPAK